MVKKIRIFGREKQTSDGKQKFNTWSYTSDGVTFYDVKFTAECTTTPKKPGYWLVEFDTKDVSKQKGKSKDGFKYNDTLWFNNLLSAIHDEAYEKKVADERQAEIDAMFNE